MSVWYTCIYMYRRKRNKWISTIVVSSHFNLLYFVVFFLFRLLLFLTSIRIYRDKSQTSKKWQKVIIAFISSSCFDFVSVLLLSLCVFEMCNSLGEKHRWCWTSLIDMLEFYSTENDMCIEDRYRWVKNKAN